MACVSGGSRTQATPHLVSWDAGCEDARSLVLVCREDEEECGLFSCRDVFAPEVLLAYRGGGGVPLFGASPAPRRWWGRVPPGFSWGHAVLTFRTNRHFDPKPPPFVLPPGRWARHHLFPQARELREWFQAQGVADIHQYTILIPESVHVRVHAGGARGGLWNQAWKNFIRANPTASSAEIYRHAGEWLYRFQLTGPIVPYHGAVPSR
ncbi:TIGR02269 family lipoprotein [Archangium primigenium]|uniref:SitA6 family polymorphic toxin lipoprotein n=1 Tax=[Archangium] primigenium TaxID=2792470 RepID=UPI00195E79AF|nr:TIGR02269 family lipoprotein [Archangium primigenium]